MVSCTVKVEKNCLLRKDLTEKNAENAIGIEEWVKTPAKGEDGCLSCRPGEAMWPWNNL